MAKKRKIIGAKVRLKCEITTRGGRVFPAGEIFTIYHSFRGYSLTNDNGMVTRVSPGDVEFIDE